MAAGVYDLEIEQGATLTFDVRYLDSTGQPIDLSRFDSGEGHIRWRPFDNKLLAIINVELEDPAAGLLKVTLNADALVGVRVRGRDHSDVARAVYDIELYDGDTVVRLLHGIAYISPEVTR